MSEEPFTGGDPILTEEPTLEQPNNKKRPFPTSLFVVVGVIVLVVVIFAIANKEDDQDEAMEEETVGQEEEMETVVESSGEGETNFEYLTPLDWNETDVATINIGVLGQGQEITGGIIIDPTTEDTAYFASTILKSDPETSYISIYKYHPSNNNFERLFRSEYSSGEFGYLGEGVPTFRVYGYDNGKLIIQTNIIGVASEECGQPLLMGVSDRGNGFNLLSMLLDDPYAGFEEYVPPASVTSEVEADKEACLNQ